MIWRAYCLYRMTRPAISYKAKKRENISFLKYIIISLDDYRNNAFRRAISSGSFKPSFYLANLPPSCADAKQLSYSSFLTYRIGRVTHWILLTGDGNFSMACFTPWKPAFQLLLNYWVLCCVDASLTDVDCNAAAKTLVWLLVTLSGNKCSGHTCNNVPKLTEEKFPWCRW